MLALPRLGPRFGADGCRIECGAYEPANRLQAGAVYELYRNPSAGGVCRSDCADPVPDTTCRAGRCALVDPIALRVAGVRARPPTITGPLAAVDVQRVVAQGVPALERCAERPRRLSARNDLALEFVLSVDGAGRVTLGEPSWLAERYPDIEACVRRAIEAWRLPAPLGGRSARVTYPLTFNIAAP